LIRQAGVARKRGRAVPLDPQDDLSGGRLMLINLQHIENAMELAYAASMNPALPDACRGLFRQIVIELWMSTRPGIVQGS
jgi:hypothetical protein